MTAFPEFIQKLPALDIDLSGVSGHILQAADHQVVFVTFDEDTVVPVHSHRAQWELVIAGKVCLAVEGKEHIYRSGESFYLPAGVEHGAVVHAGYRAVIVFDQPDRYAAR